MLDHLKALCEISGASGNERSVAEYIQSVISPFCTCELDSMGNLIGTKKGASRPVKRVMLDAHMDEVGVIVTSITEDGFLHIRALGGIHVESLVGKRVRFGQHVGVIGVKPIHLLHGEESKKMPDPQDLTVDIGAKDRDDARNHVRIGEIGTFDSDYVLFGDGYIKGRALDDRVGCAILMDLICGDSPYDFCFSFSVQEELGLRGAKVASFRLNPDCALALEATTAADLAGTPDSKTVCALGKGAVVSFMDGATLYDPALYQAALSLGQEHGIAVQSKQAVAGGNDSGAIHLSREGVRSFTLSVPCRYLHSPGCVIKRSDAESVEELARLMLCAMAEGGP